MDDMQRSRQQLAESIARVESEVKAVEAEIEEAKAAGDRAEVTALREKEKQLREKERLLLVERSGTAGSGEPSLPRLKALLGSPRASESGVIRRIYQRFPGRVAAVVASGDEQLALDLFEDARCLPSFTTVADMAASGLELGDAVEGTPLTHCFKGLSVLVVKHLLAAEARRVQAFQDALRESAAELNQHIVPFELWHTPTKHFIIMPKLAATLSSFPWLAPECALVLVTELSEALGFLRSLGFAHCDVKADNVCVTQSGSCVLVDLGSVARHGQVAQSTRPYLPTDVYRGDTTPVVSSCQLDAYMLGATLAEKCCTRECCLNFADKRMAWTHMREHLIAHLKPPVWAAYAELLRACDLV